MQSEASRCPLSIFKFLQAVKISFKSEWMNLRNILEMKDTPAIKSMPI